MDRFVRYHNFDPPAVQLATPDQSGYRLATTTDTDSMDVVLGPAHESLTLLVSRQSAGLPPWISLEQRII